MQETHAQRLERNSRNTNRGTPKGREALKNSVRQDGWADPGVVSADGVILVGNHRHDLAVERGEQPLIIPVDGKRPVFIQRTDVQSGTVAALRIAANSNRVAVLNQDIDDDAVLEQAEELGVSADELNLDVEVPEEADETDDEESESVSVEVPATPLPVVTPADSKCRTGDLWAIGDHKLLIGDCRDTTELSRLFAGDKAHITVTSPPYADSAKGKTRREYDVESGFVPISPEGYLDWFEPVQANIKFFLETDGSFFLNIKAGAETGERNLYVLDLVTAMKRKWGWKYVDEHCWYRKAPPGKWPDRLRNDFEPVHQFTMGRTMVRHASISYETDRVPKGKKRDGNMGSHWNRDNAAEPGMALHGNHWDICVSKHGTTHKAVFPIGVPKSFLLGFSDKGNIVFDPFGGSGTTLIAAHETQRIARLCEISPMYGNEIIGRAGRAGLTATLLERKNNG